MIGNSTSRNQNSAFTGILYSGGASFTGTYSFPSKRYYDKYSYGTSNTEYTKGKLGDATIEMVATTKYYSWYKDSAYFLSSGRPWFVRGGYYENGSSAGAFQFDFYDGTAGQEASSRAVISNLK